SNWWPTNNPERLELAKAFYAAKQEYPTLLAAWEKANEKYQEQLAAYREAVARKEKGVKKPGNAPRKPREPQSRKQGIAPVAYPLTLTRVIVAMPPHVIYINREIPVVDPTIWIDRIGCLYEP